MDTNVDESAEMRDVGDDAFQHHPWFQVLHAVDTIVEMDDSQFTRSIYEPETADESSNTGQESIWAGR